MRRLTLFAGCVGVSIAVVGTRVSAGPSGWITPATLLDGRAAESTPVVTPPPSAAPAPTPVGETADEAAPPPVEDLCQPPPRRLITRCEAGGPFLCVDTPPGGTTADTATLTGRVNRAEFAFSALHLAAQHDQTKLIIPVTTPEIGADGQFQVTIPLAQLGDYTVVVQALRVTGAPVVERVRFARVIAPVADRAMVAITPAPPTSGALAADHVDVAVDLLPQCERCDLLGSATGGTTLTVTNTITHPQDGIRQVTRTADLGVDGLYHLCLPVVPGSNRIEVTACNAATGADPRHCPYLPATAFVVAERQPRIELLEPAGDEPIILDAQTAAQVRLAFRVANVSLPTTCDDAVTVEWNRETAQAVCPDAGGVYRLTLRPDTGINLATIRVRDGEEVVERLVTIGWGRLVSPWQAPGQLKPLDALWARDAITLGVRQQFMAETVRTIINHVAASDRFAEFLQTLTDPAASTPADQTATHHQTEMDRILASIPFCQAPDPNAPQMTMRLVEPPHLGRFEIGRIQFAQDEMQFDIELRDIELLLRYFRDNDHDGQPDLKAMPLKIAFKKLLLRPKVRLQRGAAPLVLLTADTTDCDYQSEAHCRPRPAVILPQHFVGGATPLGGFVLCDHVDQSIAPEDLEGCRGLNILNAQTGILNQQVLDAVNQLLYCNGSAALTYLLRDGASDLDLRVGCFAPDEIPPAGPSPLAFTADFCATEDQPLWHGRQYRLPLGLDLVHSELQLNAQGMAGRVATRIGNDAFYRGLSAAMQSPRVGYFTDPGPARLPHDHGLAGTRDVTLNLGEVFLNQLLYAVAVQDSDRGLLDWDLDETFFNRLGFDFVQECDGPRESDTTASDEPAVGTAGGLCQAAPPSDKPSTLCDLRPRVDRLLGTVLPNHGYLSAKHPLQVRVRGSRTLAPRLRFYTADLPSATTGGAARHAQLVDIALADLELGFYAVQTDATQPTDVHGNPVAVHEADGTSRILSMRPPVSSSDAEPSPILRAHLSLLLSLELGAVTLDTCDPSHLILPIRINAERTRFKLSPIAGSNATVLPAAALLSSLQEKIQIGLREFGKPEAEPLKIPLLKRMAMQPMGPTTRFSELVGLTEIRVDQEAMALGIDPTQDYLSLSANLNVTQRLTVDGQVQEWQIPGE